MCTHVWVTLPKVECCLLEFNQISAPVEKLYLMMLVHLHVQRWCLCYVDGTPVVYWGMTNMAFTCPPASAWVSLQVAGLAWHTRSHWLTKRCGTCVSSLTCLLVLPAGADGPHVPARPHQYQCPQQGQNHAAGGRGCQDGRVADGKFIFGPQVNSQGRNMRF